MEFENSNAVREVRRWIRNNCNRIAAKNVVAKT